MGSSSLTRDRTWAPCTGRTEFRHQTAKEVPVLSSLLGVIFLPDLLILGNFKGQLFVLFSVCTHCDLIQSSSFEYQHYAKYS